MENRLQAALAAALLTAASAASGQGLTVDQARTLIAPWYGLFNQPKLLAETGCGYGALRAIGLIALTRPTR